MNAFVQLVSGLGFPIAAYIGLFWYIVKQDERHKAEMDKLAEALNNNTVAITKLSAAMEERKNAE